MTHLLKVINLKKICWKKSEIKNLTIRVVKKAEKEIIISSFKNTNFKISLFLEKTLMKKNKTKKQLP